MALYKRIICFVFLFILTITAGAAIAQTVKDTSGEKINAPADSTGLPAEIDSASLNAAKQKVIEHFKDSGLVESDTIVPILVKKIQSITELIGTASRISEKGFDTLNIFKNLPLTEHLLDIVEFNFISRNAFQNLRALKTTKSLLSQSEAQLESWQNTLFVYADELANLKVKLAEVRTDSILKKLPKDSMLRDIYFGQIAGLLIRWKMADSAINISMLRLGVLENRVASNYLKTKDYLSKTDDRLKKYIEELWIPEEPFLFKARQADYDVSFGEAYADSIGTVGKLIVYYLERETNFWVIAIILIMALYGWLLRTFFELKKQNKFVELKANSRLVTKYPLLSAAGLVLTFIAIFFFSLPPSWNSLAWAMLAVIFFILSRLTEKTKKTFRPEFLIIFLIFNNLSGLLKNSLGERWLQFILDLATTGYGIFMIRQMFKKTIAYPPYSKRIFFVFTIFSFAALVTNLYGSFMLAKALNNGAVYALIAANVLYIASEMIVRIIFLQDEAFKGNRFASYFNLYRLQQTIGKLLHVAAIVGWVIIMIQQLNLFDYAYDWVFGFLTNERKLGGHSFAFGSILIFILVIWFSSFLSKIIMVFFGGEKNNAGTKKNWWSSMLILIRLGILTTGILIAFVASGIPLDKLTIIIGALGVGIGFGLQNIVNNLVSGVILAFERPVQVGDAIEVGNRYGIIKEIGIRSSKIVTVEGSEVIVPNGDMLSQHIVNWTLSSHYRRVEVIVGVSYKTDLRIAEKILEEIVSTQKGIETSPPPIVLAHHFSESAIDFRLLFWCHIDTWISVKSEVMMNIHRAFGEHGIEIPFPQRDINIKGAEHLLHNEEKKEENEEPMRY